MEKYIIASGGTGGHINPALEIARALKNQGKEVIFIGSSNRLEERLIPKDEFNLITLDLSYKRNISSIYKMIKAVFKVIKIIKSMKIDRIIGFGSYISLPTLLSALILRKEIYLHEQNLKMGLTNRIFKRFAKKVFISFPSNDFNNNYILTGNAIRDDFYKLNRKEEREKLNIKENDKAILIVGGSQGSKAINEIILKNIEKLLEIKNLKIFWIVGKEEFSEKITKYNNIKSFIYTDDIPSLMLSADLMISRAGATTLFEILASKTPTIFIPYVSRKVGQIENAKFLYSITNVEYFLEPNIERAIDLILNLINDDESLNNIRESLEKVHIEKAKDKILKELL